MEISPGPTTHDHRNTVAMVIRNTKNADKHVGIKDVFFQKQDVKEDTGRFSQSGKNKLK